MLDTLFTSVLGSSGSVAETMTAANFLLCCVASLVLGAACAGIYMFKHKYSKNFVVTLALLPLVVQMVIVLVNGNLGAGIAVMGVFNLVRFRSIAGTAKDIGSVFFAMAIGLATGMGFITLAVLFTIILAAANIAYTLSNFGEESCTERLLKITVPEDLEYEYLFENVLQRYTKSYKLSEVSTTNMGSLYNLIYEVTLADSVPSKRLIDEVRCLNGNLKVSLCHKPVNQQTL